MTHYTTFLSINPALPAASRYRVWLSPMIRDCIEIDSYEDTSDAATMRALRLFSEGGDLLLIPDHATAPAATVRRASVAQRLRLSLIPRHLRPYDPEPALTPHWGSMEAGLDRCARSE